MAGTALAKFGLKPADFYNLTPKEFNQALKDYNKTEERRERFELEKMRIQTMYYVKCHANITDDPRQFMPFDFDKIETFVPTETDWDYLDNVYKEWQAKQ